MNFNMKKTNNIKMDSITLLYTDAQKKLQEIFIREYIFASGDFINLKTFFKANDISVKTRQHGEYTVFQLKYGPLCEFTEQWMHAARGTTFLMKSGKLVMSTFCFNKFFNFHEMPKFLGITDVEYVNHIKSTGATIILTNKEDGSNIKTWYDADQNVYSCTLGSIDPNNLMQSILNGSPTFWNLSIELLSEQYPKILEYLKTNPGVCLVSEMKSPWNQIVTLYDHEKRRGTITPLAIIGIDGVPRWKPLEKIYPELFNNNGHPINSMILESYPEDIEKYYKYLESNPQNVGIHPEGCVAYAVINDMVIPFAKGKRKAYVELHRSVQLNPGSIRDLYVVQKLFIDDKFDDEAELIGKDMRDAHIDEFRNALRLMSFTLNNFLPKLIATQNNAKDYAEVVKIIPQTIKWMSSNLFKLRNHINYDIDSYDLLILILKTEIRVGFTTLKNVQDTFGLKWWNQVPEVSVPNIKSQEVLMPNVKSQKVFISEVVKPREFLVVADFDGTLSSTTHTNWMEIKDVTPYERIFNILKSYNVMNAQICIVTGRDKSLESQISSFVKLHLGINVDVYCNSIGTSKLAHKMGTLSSLLNDNIGTVIYLEDDLDVLYECSKIVNSKGIRYFGHVIKNDKVTNIITQSKRATIVTLVQGPGSGKSSMFRMLEDALKTEGRDVVYVSPDRISREWSTENPNEKIPPEVMYRKLSSKFSQGVGSGAVVIVDMCHDRADFLKNILSSDSNQIVGSFIKIAETKGKKGLVKCVDPNYMNFTLNNVKNRIEAKSSGNIHAMNGSTLDGDILRAVEIATSKINGCLQQVLNRNIELFDNKEEYSISIEEGFKLLKAKIDSFNEEKKIYNVNAYVGIPSVVGLEPTPVDHWDVCYPHITTVPPTSNLNEHVHRLGNTVEFMKSTLIECPNIMAHHVKIDGLDDEKVYHITRFVRTKHKPVEANNEVSVLMRNGGLKDIEYSRCIGFEVLM